MNLGFHYHTPALKSNSGRIFTAGYLGVFIDSLAEEFESITCFMHEPLPSEISKMDYEIKGENVKLYSIGPHYSLPKRLLENSRIIKQLKDEFKNLDILLIRAPTPLIKPIYLNAAHYNLPIALLLVGDYVASAKESKTFFLKKWLIQCFSYFNDKQQKRIARIAFVFVNSRLLYEEYRKRAKGIIEIRTTTLSIDDFSNRLDTCTGNEIQLLYTGRIDLAKGLMEMVKALLILNKKEMKFTLNIVGWEEKASEPIKNALLMKVKRANQESQLIFHKKKTLGEELNKMYRMADIYLIASKGSEGFPRTIWEAMANGLPVIASEIGSIPYFLSNRQNALFIKPKNVMDIVNKVKEVVKNDALRKKLILNGYKIAKSNTLEIQAKNIKVNIGKYLSNEN